jgi:DivIVA domain-containing protein
MISLAVVLALAALAWGVAALLLGRDRGLEPAEPDGRSVPLPSARPLTESDLGDVRFDTAARGYRMDQVDAALRRAAYDIGYKEELIGVLEAEVVALREGRRDEADALLEAREAASRPRTGPVPDDVADEIDAVEPVRADSLEVGSGPVVGGVPGAGAVPGEPVDTPAKPSEVVAPVEPAEVAALAEPAEVAAPAEPAADLPEEPAADAPAPAAEVTAPAEPAKAAKSDAATARVKPAPAAEPDDSVDDDLTPADAEK